MWEEVTFGSKTIVFRLDYSARKSLGITVTPDLEVVVKAPNNTAVEKIREKVKSKAPWIIKQIGFFLSFQPKTPARKYVSGETHLYLGRQYRLKVQLGTEESVKLKGKFLLVTAKSKSKVEVLIKSWYLDHAKFKFSEFAQPIIERFKKYRVKPQSIVLREMATRWGSCTPRGKIILNPELIKAPKGCIEYVILHELCHLVYHNHSSRFFSLQSREMKDWEKWKNKLERLLV